METDSQHSTLHIRVHNEATATVVNVEIAIAQSRGNAACELITDSTEHIPGKVRTNAEAPCIAEHCGIPMPGEVVPQARADDRIAPGLGIVRSKALGGAGIQFDFIADIPHAGAG